MRVNIHLNDWLDTFRLKLSSYVSFKKTWNLINVLKPQNCRPPTVCLFYAKCPNNANFFGNCLHKRKYTIVSHFHIIYFSRFLMSFFCFSRVEILNFPIHSEVPLRDATHWILLHKKLFGFLLRSMQLNTNTVHAFYMYIISCTCSFGYVVQKHSFENKG